MTTSPASGTTGSSASSRPSTVDRTRSTPPCRAAASASDSQSGRDRGSVGLDRSAATRGLDPLVLAGRELERVDGEKRGLVPVGLDPRENAELVEERRHLLGRRFDHPDESQAALVEPVVARQRAREAVDRGKRRAQIVARQ